MAGRITPGPNALALNDLFYASFVIASDGKPALAVTNTDGTTISGGGGGGGLAVTDGAAWTAGTSTFTPSGGVFNDSATALTSGQQGTNRLTPNRADHVNLRNNAGTEIATASNPVRVDPTGTTTQPVSGTVTANAGTNLNTSALALETGGNLATIATNTTGAATAANQTTGNTSLSTIATNTTGLSLGQGSTTSGQNGVLLQGAVTTSAPTYTTTQTSPLSLTTSGLLRVGGWPTGSSVPSTAFYMGINNGGNLDNPATIADSADAQGTTSSAKLFRIWSENAAYNGTSIDRNRNNTTGVVIAAGATATNAGVSVTTYNATRLTIVLNVSAFTSGTITVTINGVTSSGYTYPLLTSTAIGATGVTPLRIFPGATPSANSVANDMVPRTIQVVTTGTFTLTYGIDYELSV